MGLFGGLALEKFECGASEDQTNGKVVVVSGVVEGREDLGELDRCDGAATGKEEVEVAW